METTAAREATQGMYAALPDSRGTCTIAGLTEALCGLQEIRNILDACQTELLGQLAAIEIVAEEDGTLGEHHHAIGHAELDAPELAAPCLGVSVHVASRRMSESLALLTRLPALVAEMAGGRLDGWRATVIADELCDAPPAVAAAVVAELIARAEAVGGWLDSAGPLRQRTAGILATIDAALVRARRRDERGKRGLHRRVESSGLDRWEGCYPIEEARLAWDAIDVLARQLHQDGKADTLAQARADAHLQLLLGQVSATIHLHPTIAADDVPAPEARSGPDAGTPTGHGRDRGDGGGMDDHPERHHDESAHHAQPGHHAEPEQVNESGRDPDDDGGATEARGADLPEETTEEGCPPSAHITEVATDDLPDDDTLVELGGFAGLASALVSASWLARALAEGRAKLAHRVHCDRVTGALTTALTGMTVTPLGIGVEGELVEDRYRPSASLRALVQARDGTCRFPGCQRHARFCDLDHVRPWPGGPTAASNLMALCRRHHRIKQRPAWRVQLLPDGRARWFFPDGRTVLTHPVDHLAATRPFLLPTSTSPTDPGSDAPAAQRLRKTPCRTQEELDAEEPYGIDDHSPLLEHYLRRIADHQALPLREQTRLAANAQRRERERRLGTRHGPVEEITVDLGGQLIRWTPYWRHHVEEIPLPGASGSRSGPHASAQPVKPALLHLSYPLWNWDDPPF